MTIIQRAMEFLRQNEGEAYVPPKLLEVAAIPGGDATLSRKLRKEEENVRPKGPGLFGEPMDLEPRLRKLDVLAKNGRWNTAYYYGPPMSPEKEAQYQADI